MAKTTTAAKGTKAAKGMNGKSPKVTVTKVAGVSVHAGEPTREPVWNARRTAIVKAMRALGATSPATAATPADIAAKAAKLGAPELADASEFCGRPHKGVYLTAVCLDVYRTAELVHNGFAAPHKVEGERGLRYYLTKAGVKTTFPAPAKKAAE